MALKPYLVLGDLPKDRASSTARRLQLELRRQFPELEVAIEKPDAATQDFGSTLVLVLGAPAVVALAKGIADFLRKERVSLEIRSGKTKVIATGLKSEDAAKIAESILQAKE